MHVIIATFIEKTSYDIVICVHGLVVTQSSANGCKQSNYIKNAFFSGSQRLWRIIAIHCRKKLNYITLYWCQLCNYFFFSEIACLPSYQHNEPKKAFYCIYIHVVKRIDSKFNWINKFQELDSYLTEFHKIIQVWYDSQKTKKTPQEMFVH